MPSSSRIPVAREAEQGSGVRGLLLRVWYSLVRIGWPQDERSSIKAMLSSVTLHVHAPKVRAATLKLRAHWGLGFISFWLAVLLTVSGVYLMFYYFPHPDAAYRSMKDLRFVVPLGVVTRNLHRWAAHAMVVFVTLHMIRVFLSGGYKHPREANWAAGVGLWVLTLALSFTGYLLPWDQLAYWAVTVGANMAGTVPWLGATIRELLLGDTAVGETALLRFYVLHCVFLPLAMGVFVCFHIFRVRKDGGLVTTEHDPEGDRSAHAGKHLVPAWPHLVYRELVLALACTALVLLVSLIADAPLEPEADPARTPNPAKAPWYFLGIQELAHWSAFWGGVAVPGAVVLGLCLLPYLDRRADGMGRYWPRERRLANTLFLLLMLFFAVTTTIGTLFRGPAWQLMWWPH